MSLLDEAIGLQQKPGTPCKIDELRRDRPDLHAEIVEALASSVQATALSKALQARGVTIGADALNRHRRGDCLRCR